MTVRAAWSLILIAACGLPLACSAAVVADTSLRSGRPVDLAQFGAVHHGQSKDAVLPTLGPPVEILSPATGDVFVYRLAQVNLFFVQINSSLFGGPGVPLWAYYDGLGADTAAYVFFDAEGQVAQVARRDPLRLAETVASAEASVSPSPVTEEQP